MRQIHMSGATSGDGNGAMTWTEGTGIAGNWPLPAVSGHRASRRLYRTTLVVGAARNCQ